MLLSHIHPTAFVSCHISIHPPCLHCFTVNVYIWLWCPSEPSFSSQLCPPTLLFCPPFCCPPIFYFKLWKFLLIACHHAHCVIWLPGLIYCKHNCSSWYQACFSFTLPLSLALVFISSFPGWFTYTHMLIYTIRLHRKGNNHVFFLKLFYMITKALCHCTNVALRSLHMIMNVFHCNLHIKYYISFFRLSKVFGLSCTSFIV